MKNTKWNLRSMVGKNLIVKRFEDYPRNPKTFVDGMSMFVLGVFVGLLIAFFVVR